VPAKVDLTPKTSFSNSRRCISGAARSTVFDCALLDARPSSVTLRIAGSRAADLFRDETGKHCWMRVPPNDKRGRVQTSTVTVAVLPEVSERTLSIPERDLEISVCRGSGAGGQHRNKTESAVMMKHVPTGVIVRCESERSQIQNRASALEVLRARLGAAARTGAHLDRNAGRREQLEGSKRRTVRVPDGQVVDHLTGRVWKLRDYLKGTW